ncbi:helix-turn-helix transcriptional regulator [Rathayibacter tanaceti]|uniref:Helix-turn-helix domain protein n=2 Tax=Rathayibacter tanaceti TaxID=1671680 RepID=A0A162FYZ6_9MICO|nr:helix-turn-helix transcriptional regulator [Rathayibacter tanaceti]KZX21620.1 Helix-turn-helix domain protein [Rathayibacter tanaceti]QHC56483.1 hypothetical protein GSU10_13160 [Rathayibacter tanaceti]TCO36690.1 hypothetical protein EV639_10693 [Rathayibacter tanaceti]
MRVPEARASGDLGVALVGDEAADWLVGQGMRVVSPGKELRVLGDRLQIGDVTVRRLYHSGRRVIRQPTESGLLLCMLVDGEIGLASRDEEMSLMKGEGYLSVEKEDHTVISESSYGVVEVEVSALFSSRFGVPIPARVTRIEQDSGSLRILLATVISTLNAASTLTASSWGHLAGCIESAAAAVVSECGPSLAQGTPTVVGRLLARADAVLRTHYADESFGVGALAEILAVSTSSLHAAFSMIGTTPMRELRRVRVDAALRILGRRSEVRREDEEEAARLVGFSSRRALVAARRAVDAEERIESLPHRSAL